DSVRITPAPLTGPADIYCGLAGTVMRFVPPMAALATGDIRFDGDAGARSRPMAETIGSLRQLGVRVESSPAETLPFSLAATGRVPGGEVTLDASRSSQFVSGLLLSAARYDIGAIIRHQGAALPSQPHIDMTLKMISDAGVQVESLDHGAHDVTWRVRPGPVDLPDLDMEPDLSNAAAFLAAGMVTGGSVTIPDWPAHTTQPGDQIRGVFEQMGAHSSTDATGLTLTGPATLHGIDIDLRNIGELTPTIAAVALFADTESRFRGIGHLRGHETDRLAALATEIGRLGGRAEQTEDGLLIRPAALHPADLRTYHDHRMATFAAIVGLVVPGVRVEDIATTSKTLPDFIAQWNHLVDVDGAHS
ncbi:MAG: 3-phosphoshikimate 1-carboxyvinyltransferase, partial [Actinomycetes bacterium]